jgi:RimJ/RimL family protein N-acetyltransferase
MILTTKRLIIRKAAPEDSDIDFLFRLWTHPEVMKFVGFPHGLRITRDEIRQQIRENDNTAYDQRLIVVLKATGLPIGQAKLGRPDREGLSETDVKLLPEYWGQGLGTEIKRGLVAYLFAHTDCRAVKATPNRANVASQKMQEAVGGKRIGEGVFRFPENMRAWTCDVPHYVYLVTREDWEKRTRTHT